MTALFSHAQAEEFALPAETPADEAGLVRDTLGANPRAFEEIVRRHSRRVAQRIDVPTAGGSVSESGPGAQVHPDDDQRRLVRQDRQGGVINGPRAYFHDPDGTVLEFIDLTSYAGAL